MAMDPDQRIALEVAYEAMQQSGLKLDGVPKSGIFVGECNNDFASMETNTVLGPYSATGGASSITANRISYAFGLRGPSVTMDTACSSSLVAMDAACKA
eukprot:3558218-Rhodomonas_salina.1